MTTSSKKKILTDAHHDFATGLSRYARLKISDQTLSDDLVQVTFMKTWLYLQKSGKIDLMRAFLYHVLNGLIIDEYRKRKTVSLDLLSEAGFELRAINSENLFNIIDGGFMLDLIHHRGQLSVYIRPMGGKVPSIYGPSADTTE